MSLARAIPLATLTRRELLQKASDQERLLVAIRIAAGAPDHFKAITVVRGLLDGSYRVVVTPTLNPHEVRVQIVATQEEEPNTEPARPLEVQALDELAQARLSRGRS